MRKCILASQKKNKSNFDSKHRVREVNLTVGQWVRVKSVRKVARGSRKFSIPKQIMKVMNNTLELDDDSIGHMSSLASARHDIGRVEDTKNRVENDWVDTFWWLCTILEVAREENIIEEGHYYECES